MIVDDPAQQAHHRSRRQPRRHLPLQPLANPPDLRNLAHRHDPVDPFPAAVGMRQRQTRRLGGALTAQDVPHCRGFSPLPGDVRLAPPALRRRQAGGVVSGHRVSEGSVLLVEPACAGRMLLSRCGLVDVGSGSVPTRAAVARQIAAPARRTPGIGSAPGQPRPAQRHGPTLPCQGFPRGPAGESRLCAAIGSRSVRRPRASAPSQRSRPGHRGHGAGRRTGRGRRSPPTPGAHSPRSVARSSRGFRLPAGPAPTPRHPVIVCRRREGSERTGQPGYPLVGYPGAGRDIRHPLTGTPPLAPGHGPRHGGRGPRRRQRPTSPESPGHHRRFSTGLGDDLPHRPPGVTQRHNGRFVHPHNLSRTTRRRRVCQDANAPWRATFS